MTDGTFGPCCTGGDCCGPGSYCCANTGPHDHPEETEVRICPTCEGAGIVENNAMTPELQITTCPACGGAGDTGGLEIINTTPPPGTCTCSKGTEIIDGTRWFATFATDPKCPEHGADLERYMQNGLTPGYSIDEDENNE